MPADEAPKSGSKFEEAVSKEGESSLVADTIGFLKENKKWWLAPIIVFMVMMGALLLLSGTAVAPFIYTLF